MNKIVNFIIWPAIAGLVFALVILQIPRFSGWLPALGSVSTRDSGQTTAMVFSFNEAIERAAPAVVSINSQQVIGINAPQSSFAPIDNNNIISNLLSRSFIEFDESHNLGSGVIISPEGYIITSYHIFFTPEATRLNESSTVTLHDGRTFNARPVYLDEHNDLALLKIDADNISYLDPGIDLNLRVGDVVLAIGNPRNIGQSASLGIISALLEEGDSYVIQTDAAINPGNSGGALINSNGQLIGINSTIISESGGSEGIGFATPALKAKALLDSYIASGPGGYLGIQDAELMTERRGLLQFGSQVQGVYVNSVARNGPADNAGIMAGDVIVGVNEQRFELRNEEDMFQAINYISSQGAGQTITVVIYRNGDYLEIPVTLGVGEPILFFTPTPVGPA